MAGLVLAVAPGSSSTKYALVAEGVEQKRVEIKRDESGGTFLDTGLISEPSAIQAVGLRVVAPGQDFATHKRIDEPYAVKLRAVAHRSPLHVPPVLDELTALQRLLPHAPVVAASDSAFHATLPERAWRYAIPTALAEPSGIRRTGYHGLSVASVMRRAKTMVTGSLERVIVCHLGSGVSITAVQASQSIDTSMGFTPLAGVPMGTRVGDIDPGALLALLDSAALDSVALQTVLTEQSGLAALSEQTGDVKTLLALRSSGNERAAFALETFLYRIQSYVGAYVATLGGLDALLLTGAISEGSAALRAELCGPLGVFGVTLDEAKNSGIDPLTGGSISEEHVPVTVAVIPTDELGEIARIAAELA